jgi:hypothetical protein
VIVLGHEPAPVSVILTAKDEVFSTQLSEAVPPPARNAVKLANGAGIAAEHWVFVPAGQVIVGLTVSSIVIVCVHCAMLPHESAISYVRIMILGQVIPLFDSV